MLLALLALAGGAAACKHPPPGRMMPGASSPRAAVESFLKSVRAQDLQAMSDVWGTKEGLARDKWERPELEKRELIMMCLFNHDRYRILSEAPGEAGHRVFHVELARAGITRTTNFYTIQGPSERWFVENADVTPVKDLCKQ
jgi:hypothetical protein